MSDWHRQLAESDFHKARNKALLSRVSGFLGLEPEGLLPYDEVRKLVRPSSEHYSGIRSVPVDLIAGSEGRYGDFDRHFLPRLKHLRKRWVSIDMAHYGEVTLPPVLLYELGGLYFVRDGNHRISVARMRGQESVDAEVTSLESRVRLERGITLRDLRAAVIAWEKREFLSATGYTGITGDDDLDFTSPGRYDLILEHVEKHKYYLNLQQEEEIPFGDALWSWHENVYGPVVLAIREEALLRDFPGRTAADLYVFLVAHWDELKRTYGIEVGVGEAARDYRGKHRGGEFSRFREFLRKLL